MSRTTEFLMNIRSIIKLHESMLREICGEYQLALIEATIISFLHNNPGKDTAADIVELRMLSKGNVSQAVESLIQRSLLRREQDAVDRRRIHLFLTPAAGLSCDERAIFERVNDRISDNTRRAMARRTRK